MLLTNNEGNHGCSIAASSLQALDQLLDLPDLDVLLGLVRLGVAHFGCWGRFKYWKSREMVRRDASLTLRKSTVSRLSLSVSTFLLCFAFRLWGKCDVGEVWWVWVKFREPIT